MKCSSSFSSTSSSSPALSGFRKFASQAFVAAMSCIFSCFRIKDDSPPSALKDPNTEETEVNRNRSSLSALFMSEEDACSDNKEKGSQERNLDFEDQKNQAKFHKACGTTPETPAETRKIAEGKIGKSSQNEAVESLKLKSWLTYTSVEKLDLENQSDQLQDLTKDCEEWIDSADAQEHTPSRQNTERVLPDSNGGGVVVGNSNGMQSQVSNDGDFISDQPDRHCKESFMKADESGKAKTAEISTDKDLISVESPNLDVPTAVKSIHRVINPSDRPIIGLVAAHWNDNEPSRVSPKWWDGNGIPNSTNKYQEDQKVSWHATPFEERLEKALSEETLISQRRQSTGTQAPINFGETEESDTATSQLQPSTHFKPVVSV